MASEEQIKIQGLESHIAQLEREVKALAAQKLISIEVLTKAMALIMDLVDLIKAKGWRIIFNLKEMSSILKQIMDLILSIKGLGLQKPRRYVEMYEDRSGMLAG